MAIVNDQLLSLGVLQHMHKIIQIIENTPLSHEVVCFQRLDFGTSNMSKSNSEVSKSNSNILVERYFFLKNYVTSEEAVSHNVLYY